MTFPDRLYMQILIYVSVEINPYIKAEFYHELETVYKRFRASAQVSLPLDITQ